MYEDESMQPDLLEITDDEGNTITVQVMDYFYYNGEEYAILANNVPDEENTAEVPDEIDCFVARVNVFTDENGDEMEEFVPVEDAALESKLIEIASSRMNEDEEV